MFYVKYFLNVCVKCDNILKIEIYNKVIKYFVFFFLIKYEILELDKECYFKYVVDDEYIKKLYIFFYIYV